jgi:hypothetical protein
MRSIVLLISVLFVPILARSQTPVAPEAPADLQIIKYSWTKDRLNWERDPFRGTGERLDTRDRITTERRRPTALEERQARDQRADKEKPTSPPRYAFNYRLTVQNTGPKTIKEIDWDYIFKDSATGEQLGRREFTSVEKIGPGKRKELSVLLSSPPTQRISIKTLGEREHDGLAEQVIVVRILYADGTTWPAH